MILKLAYTGNDLDFHKKVEKLLEEYPLVELQSFCKDKYQEQKNYYKLIQHYATRAGRFMVLTDNEHNIIQPFYVEDKTCDVDYLKIVLDHWVLYNPFKDGRSGSEEETGGA